MEQQNSLWYFLCMQLWWWHSFQQQCCHQTEAPSFPSYSNCQGYICRRLFSWPQPGYCIIDRHKLPYLLSIQGASCVSNMKWPRSWHLIRWGNRLNRRKFLSKAPSNGFWLSLKNQKRGLRLLLFFRLSQLRERRNNVSLCREQLYQQYRNWRISHCGLKILQYEDQWYREMVLR